MNISNELNPLMPSLDAVARLINFFENSIFFQNCENFQEKNQNSEKILLNPVFSSRKAQKKCLGGRLANPATSILGEVSFDSEQI